MPQDAVGTESRTQSGPARGVGGLMSWALKVRLLELILRMKLEPSCQPTPVCEKGTDSTACEAREKPQDCAEGSTTGN